MAVPTLLYGSEIRTMTEKDIQILETAEIHFLRSVNFCKNWIKLGTKIRVIV
jgi:hypothetical protein